MDPASNPYAPGAGTPPPELAGRDALRRAVGIKGAENTRFVEELTRPELRAPNVDIG